MPPPTEPPPAAIRPGPRPRAAPPRATHPPGGGRVAGDRHPLRVEAMGGALADDPARRGVALLDRDRVAGLGRAVVLDERERRAGPAGQLAHQPVVRAGVPEHPTAAVHVQDHRERALGAGRAHDAHADVAHVGRDGDPALVDRQLGDRRGLDVVEHLARLIGRQLVQIRRIGGRLDERLRGGLEHDVRQRAVDGHQRGLLWSLRVGWDYAVTGSRAGSRSATAGRFAGSGAEVVGWRVRAARRCRTSRYGEVAIAASAMTSSRTASRKSTSVTSSATGPATRSAKSTQGPAKRTNGGPATGITPTSGPISASISRTVRRLETFMTALRRP